MRLANYLFVGCQNVALDTVVERILIRLQCAVFELDQNCFLYTHTLIMTWHNKLHSFRVELLCVRWTDILELISCTSSGRALTGFCVRRQWVLCYSENWCYYLYFSSTANQYSTEHNYFFKGWTHSIRMYGILTLYFWNYIVRFFFFNFMLPCIIQW